MTKGTPFTPKIKHQGTNRVWAFIKTFWIRALLLFLAFLLSVTPLSNIVLVCAFMYAIWGLFTIALILVLKLFGIKPEHQNTLKLIKTGKSLNLEFLPSKPVILKEYVYHVLFAIILIITIANGLAIKGEQQAHSPQHTISPLDKANPK